MPCSLGCPADAAHVMHALEVRAGMAVQDTGGFFIAVLEKVAPTPPLEDPKLGHRYGVCECRSRISAPARAGLCWAVMPVLHDCRTAAWLQARCSSACPMQDVCADMCYWLSCRFLTYVQSAAKPMRVVKLDGQDPLQGAADAAEAAIQVGTISARLAGSAGQPVSACVERQDNSILHACTSSCVLIICQASLVRQLVQRCVVRVVVTFTVAVLLAEGC